MKTGDKKYIFAMLGIESKEDFEKIMDTAKKFFHTIKKKEYHTIPSDVDFVDMIVDNAFLKAVEEYSFSKNASFSTLLYNKVRGEMYKYLSKQRTIQKYGENELKGGAYLKNYGEDDKVHIEAVDNNTPEAIAIEDDIYRRRIKANQMARSELPAMLQRVLSIVLEYEKLSDAADVLGLSVSELRKLRNMAISLLDKKVSRSSHLSPEDREYFKKKYELI